MDAGALYTHFYYVTMHLLCITNTYISPIHRADLQGYVLSLAPIGEVMLCLNLGEGGRTWQTVTGFSLFTFWDKEADFFLSLH